MWLLVETHLMQYIVKDKAVIIIIIISEKWVEQWWSGCCRIDQAGVALCLHKWLQSLKAMGQYKFL